MTRQKIFSVIVAYNPDLSQLLSTIGSIQGQGSSVIVVNNGTELLISDVKVINEFKNVGIATAQNDGIFEAIANGATHIALFDQDSEVPENYFEKMLEAVETLDNVGMVAPSIFDVNKRLRVEPKLYTREKKLTLIQPSAKDTEMINAGKYRLAAVPIASGSFFPLSTINSVGVMNDNLFIDSVDTDFAIRILLSDLDIYQINNLIMNHAIGNRKPVNIGKFAFWTTNHSPMRRYMMTRNIILIRNLYSKNVRGLTHMMFRTLLSTFVYILFEQQKASKLHAFVRGMVAGVRGKTGGSDYE